VRRIAGATTGDRIVVRDRSASNWAIVERARSSGGKQSAQRVTSRVDVPNDRGPTRGGFYVTRSLVP